MTAKCWREKKTHPPISKTQRQSPWKYYSERQISALVFHSLLSWVVEKRCRMLDIITQLRNHMMKSNRIRCSPKKSAASIRGRQNPKACWNNTKKVWLSLQFAVYLHNQKQGLAKPTSEWWISDSLKSVFWLRVKWEISSQMIFTDFFSPSYIFINHAQIWLI